MSKSRKYHHRHAWRISNRRRCRIERFESRLALSATAASSAVEFFDADGDVADGSITIVADRFAYFDSFDGSVQFDDFTPIPDAVNFGDTATDGTTDFNEAGLPPTFNANPPLVPGGNRELNLDNDGFSLSGIPSVPRTKFNGGVTNGVDDSPGTTNLSPTSSSLDDPIREFPRSDTGSGGVSSVAASSRIVFKLVSDPNDPMEPSASNSSSAKVGRSIVREPSSNSSSTASIEAAAESIKASATADETMDRPEGRAIFFHVASSRNASRVNSAQQMHEAAAASQPVSNDRLVAQQSHAGTYASTATTANRGEHATYTTSLSADELRAANTWETAHLESMPSTDARSREQPTSEPASEPLAMESVDSVFASWHDAHIAAPTLGFAASDQNQQVGLALAAAALVAAEHTLGIRHATDEKSFTQRQPDGPPERCKR